MVTWFEHDLATLSGLEVRAAGTEIVHWQGRQALRLENGLALFPAPRLASAHVEVAIGVDGPAYPGIAFRVADVHNYELAYAVPHASGLWDALQYDPVLHGSNTWQAFYGPSYQGVAEVPTGRWFRLGLDFCGSRAVVSVDGQPRLAVEQLARPEAAGLLGLWTFRPAHFSGLRVSACTGHEIPSGEKPVAPEGVVTSWFVEGYGVVANEPNGVLNLNRYLPISCGEVHLARCFELDRAGEVQFGFGFSDVLSLEVDGEPVFQGENTFKGFSDRTGRGYAELGAHTLRQVLAAGAHRLTAVLRVNEPFGWGLILTVQGAGLCWLPAELG